MDFFRNTPRRFFAPSVFASLRCSVALLFFFVCLLTFAGGRSATADDYRIAAEDIIAVVVANHPEYSLDPVTVGTTGTISLPTIGAVQVAGKTLEQIRQNVTQKLKFWLKKPVVTVFLRQQRMQRISVSGAVVNVGFHPIKPGWRVSDALTAAGGLKALPEDSRATLTREGAAPIEINLVEVLANTQSAANLVLNTGDRLDVTIVPIQHITVSGDVLKPDIYELKKAPRVLDALTLAGWLKQTPTNSRAFVVRRGQKLDLNLVEAVDHKRADANLTLQAGDVVFVEAIPTPTFSVDGLVAKPGIYPLEDGMSVLQAIPLAGGLSVSNEKIAARVRRGNENIPVDLNRIAYDPQANITLKGGDVLLLSEPENIRVQISGEVSKPGQLRLRPNATLLTAIGEAGNLTLKPEDTRINILRYTEGKPTTISIDAAALLQKNDLRQNASLREGDFITVVKLQSQKVSLIGAVAKPGEYELQEGDGLAEILARAGSYSDNAALRTINITKRNGETQVHDMTALRGGAKVNVPLEEGDFITVPANNARVMIMEAVGRPGPVAIPENEPLTLGAALGQAGGPKDNARTKEIYILRRVNNQVQKQVVSLNAIYNGTPATALPLQNEDVVFVPGAKPGVFERILQNPLSLLTAFSVFFR